MDIYKFINSKDIAKHLSDIKYSFSALEAAWIVYQSIYKTMNEKVAAWEWIINNMPDMEVVERRNCEFRPSVHAVLKEYIDLIKKYLEKIKEDGTDVYYEYKLCHIVPYPFNEDFLSVFRSYKECLEDIKTGLEKPDKPYRIKICRQKYGDNSQHIEFSLNENLDVMDIYATDIIDFNYDFFEGLWFKIPVPFIAGDIVTDVRIENHPFVIKGSMGMPEEKELLPPRGDSSDMIAWGYYQNDKDGDIYCDQMWNYLNIEYYRDEFKGKRRLLVALSSFVKGDIGLEFFLMAYRKILLEEAENNKWLFSFPDDWLKKVGMGIKEG